jgi:hypothetical protein
MFAQRRQLADGQPFGRRQADAHHIGVHAGIAAGLAQRLHV